MYKTLLYRFAKTFLRDRSVCDVLTVQDAYLGGGGERTCHQLSVA